jgi:hypothetical protein
MAASFPFSGDVPPQDFTSHSGYNAFFTKLHFQFLYETSFK